MKDKSQRFYDIYSQDEFLIQLMALIAKFAKSPKKDLRKYFILLKHKKIEQFSDEDEPRLIQLDGYYLAMDHDVEKTIWQYFIRNDEGVRQLETWLRGLKVSPSMVIDYHPFLRVLAELGNFLSGRERTASFGVSGCDRTYFSHLDTCKPKHLGCSSTKSLTKDIAYINGLITLLFEYASSTIVAQEIRRLDRRSYNREDSLKQLLGRVGKGNFIEVMYFGFDCGHFFNWPQDFKSHLVKMKVITKKIISDFKNTYASRSEGRPLNLLYAWNISFVQKLENDKRIGMKFHFFLLDIRDNSKETNAMPEKTSGVENQHFITIFSDEMEQKLKQSLDALSNEVKLEVKLKSNNMGVWPLKNELIAFIVGDKIRVVNWAGEEKLATKLFDSGHL